jgi:hypothetical protein
MRSTAHHQESRLSHTGALTSCERPQRLSHFQHSVRCVRWWKTGVIRVAWTQLTGQSTARNTEKDERIYGSRIRFTSGVQYITPAPCRRLWYARPSVPMA